MRKPYHTDLSDSEWVRIEPHLPVPKAPGRPRVHPSREVLNAIFYVLRSGCAWRLLPHDFPPWKTVHHYFRIWRIDGVWEQLNKALRERLRVRLGRNPQPSAGMVDSQSAKTTGVVGEARGYTTAVRRYAPESVICWWTHREGLVLKAKVHSAKVPDQEGIKLVLETAHDRLPGLSHLWVDAGYQGRGKEWVEKKLGLSVEVVHRTPKPAPEKIARIWAEENGLRRVGTSTGRGCSRVEALRYCRGAGWWSGPSHG